MRGGHSRKASSHTWVPAHILCPCPVLAVLSKLGLGLKKNRKNCIFVCPALHGRRGAAARLNRSHAPVSTSGGLREGLI